MKFTNFLYFFPVLLLHVHSLQTFYVSNASSCTFDSCDGSQSKPFPGLISGIASTLQNANSLSDYQVAIELISDNYLVKDSHLSALQTNSLVKSYNGTSQLFERIVSGKANPFDYIRIKPSNCDENFDVYCESMVTINLKTDNFSMAVGTTTLIRNLNFIGQNLIYRHQNIVNPSKAATIDKSCLESDTTDCCTPSQFNDSSSNCYIVGLDDSQRAFQKNQDYQFGLFLHKFDNTSLNVTQSEFRYFIEIGTNSIDTFTFLFGAYIDPFVKFNSKGEVIKSLRNLSLSVNNSKFLANYFFFGLFYFSNNNANESFYEIKNCVFENYNAYAVKDQTSYYNNFSMIISQGRMKFSQNVMKNCFKAMYLDYSIILAMDNNTFIYDNSIQIQQIATISSNINIINGDNDNIYNISNTSITINLISPTSDGLFQAKDNNTLYFSVHSFQNLTGLVFLNYRDHCRTFIDNLKFVSTNNTQTGFILFDYNTTLNITNSLFKNLVYQVGNMIYFFNTSQVFVRNVTVDNISIMTTGSFMRCFDTGFCNFLMRDSIFRNVLTTSSSAIFYIQKSCNVTLDNITFTNISSSGAQGGILSGHSQNNLTFTNLLMDTVSAQEGAILYILNSNNIYLTNVSTNYCAANIPFLYYGREGSNNLNIKDCNFSNSNGTAIAQLSAGSILVHGCRFYNLSNSQSQAALIYSGSTTSLIFESNTVSLINLDSQGWGLIFLEKSCITQISDSDFRSNTGVLGSVIYASDGNTVIIYNISISDFRGNNEGVLYFESSNKVQITTSYFSNISTETDGGVISLGSQNNVTFQFNEVFQVSVNFFGAFCNLQDSNTIMISFCNISNLQAQSKGGLFYATSGNTLDLRDLNLSNIISEAGPLVGLNTKNSFSISRSVLVNAKAIRYGGLIYSFTENNLSISNSTFIDGQSQNLAGGFYLDIFNSLWIQNCSFQNFSAIESGGIVVTIYENSILLNASNFSQIWISSSNDGVVARLGLSTNINVSSCIFNDLSAQLENFVFILSDFNTFDVRNSNFTALNKMLSSSGFLQAGSNNYFDLQGLLIDFIKDDKGSSGSGILFYFLSDNKFQSKNNSLRVSYFSVLFNFEANNQASLQNLRLDKESLFDNLFFVKNNSNLQVSELRIKVQAQTIQVTDSSLTLQKTSIMIEQTQFSSLINIVSSKLVLKNCDFIVRDSNSSGNFLVAQKYSTIKIRRSSFIGFKPLESSGLSGVFDSDNCEILNIDASLLLFNKAGTDGGSISYINTGNDVYTQAQSRRILQSGQFENQILKFKNSIYLGNSAQVGEGGALYISNQNDSIIMEVRITRNHFLFNKANKGGAAYFEKVSLLKVNYSIFAHNEALLSSKQSDQTKAIGGAIFLSSKDDGTFFNVKNNYYENAGQIGGALYLSPLDLNYVEEQAIFQDNVKVYFGSEYAGPVFRISFKPTPFYSNMTKLDEIINTTIINNIQSGYANADCFAAIVGIDKYGNLALNTSDSFYNKIQFTEVTDGVKIVKIKTLFQDGALCLTSFTRAGVPVRGNSQFEVSFKRYDGETDKLMLYLNFRDCTIGEKLTTDYHCQTCPDGTYSLVKTFEYIIDNCKDCTGLNFECQSGGLYTPISGFWRYDKLSSNFLSCPKQNNCLGGSLFYNTTSYNEDLANIFGKGAQYGDQALSPVGFCKLGYKGILCNECDQGYGKVNAYTCLPCKSSGYVAWIIFQILFKLAILFSSLHISLKTSIGLYMEEINELDVTLTNLIKIMLNHMQMLIVLFTFIDFSQIYNNIISFVLGVNSNLGEAFNIECLLKSGGSNTSPLYFQFWITVLYIFPIAFICFFYVRMIHRASEKRYVKTMSFWLLFLACILIVLQLSYFDIVNITLRLFPCFNVSDDYDPESRLVFDYSIRCNDRTQIIVKYAAGLPIVLVFGLGFPLILLGILLKKLKNHTLRNDESLLAFGFFFYIYEENLFFWDILQLLRKFSMTLIQILLASSILVQNFASLEVLLLVVFSFLCLQLKLRPYLKPTFDIVNTLERTSLVSLGLTYYFALYHTGLKLDDASNIFSADLVLFFLSLLTNLGFLFYWSYIFIPRQFYSTWSKVKGVVTIILSLCKKKKGQKMNENAKNSPIHEALSGDLDGEKLANRPSLTVMNEPKSLTILNLESPPSNPQINNNNDPKNEFCDQERRGSLASKIDKAETLDRIGSGISLSFDSQKFLNKDRGQTDRKSIIFQKNIPKKEVNAFVPLEQFSFPSIPDFEEENSDLSFIGLLNGKQIKGLLLRKTFLEYEEERKIALKPIQTEIENFNKQNFTNKMTKLGVFRNEGKIHVDENCEISFRLRNFVKNSNIYKLECVFLRKKPDVTIEEIKIKLSSLKSCFEIIEDKDEEEKERREDFVVNYILVFTATYLGHCDLPSLRIKIGGAMKSDISIKLPISTFKFLDFEEVPSIFEYLRNWNCISDLELFELKKIDGTFFPSDHSSPLKILQSLFHGSVINEPDQPNAELFAKFNTFLLPKVKLFFRVKVVVKAKKGIFENTQKKHEFKVLMGMKRESESPEIFNKDKQFTKYCLRTLFCCIFGQFCADNARVIQNKLETLQEEEDEGINEKDSLKL